MKFLLFAALAGSAAADPFATDAPPDHTVYNCLKVRQDVDEANDILGNGVCDAEVNCGPFSYDLGDCWSSAEDVCAGDSWYTNGRKNFRCSTKTGGIRLGRAGSNDETGVAKHDSWTNPCDCYQECVQIAERENMELVAFDHYSGKCRCWSGTCDASDDGSLPCRNGGDQYGVGGPEDGGLGDGPELGNNWRCPSEIYFPELKYDCDGNDITFRYPDIAQYIGDGFCDNGETLNQQFAAATNSEASFNLNCEAFNYDGGDCQLDCHESIYWATDFVNLGPSKYKINECTQGQPDAQIAFTTACDCYTFCAENIEGTGGFIFDHDQADLCRCFSNIGSLADVSADETATEFCGLNSNCQIYEPNREFNCNNTDYTLGVVEGETVQSYDDFIGGNCVAEAMCMQSSYSNGGCFDCERFSTERNADAYCNGDAAMSIADADLDAMIADGYLMGNTALDTSTDDDNCACLNYCFSSLVEDAGDLEAEDVYDLFNAIAVFNFAYEHRNNTCNCYTACDEVLPCGTEAGDCDEPSTLWYSTVADLNSLE